MDTISYNQDDLDNLIIKDKEYFAKKRKKRFLILALVLSVLIAVVIVLIIIFKPKEINEIICQYKTENEEKYINIIKYMKNVDFTLIIDDIKYSKEYSHNFERAGTHNVIFQFKDKLDSLEGFFEGNQNLISANFSNLKAENIKTMKSLFSGCTNLKNFTFNSETPNLVDIRDMFYNCASLTSVNLNINTTKVIYMDYMFYNSVNLT